jgi:hypothetical protein
VIAVQGNSAFVETVPTQKEKKMEQGNSSATTGPAVPEEVMLLQISNCSKLPT